MTGVGISFAVGLLVTGGMALGSKSPRLSLFAWGTLVIGWIITVLIAPYGTRFVWLFPIFDAVFGAWAIAQSLRSRSYWPAILSLLYLGQCLIHIVWSVIDMVAPHDIHRAYRYYFALNMLLVSQMVCVAWPGLSNGVSVLLHHVRNLLGARRRKGVAP